jgi:Polyketide cyclase / dehydrase and lipid transport
MATIAGEILINRPVDEVFDFVADERNEPRYNPRMVTAEKLSAGPVGLGSWFRAETTTLGRRVPMTIELTGFEPTRRIDSVTRLPGMDIRGRLVFESAPGGTRMSWTWDLEPHGPLRLLGPGIEPIGRRQEAQIWGSLKRVLEGTTPASDGGGKALADFAACARTWCGLAARHRLVSPGEHVGTWLSFRDGTSSRVFRETALGGVRTREPVLLVIQFRLAALGSSRLLHAAFRRECVLHTPLFAGFPGFRSKLWLDDVRTGVYRGVYEWDGADLARAYARRMLGLLAPFATRGTARSHVVERLRRDDFLRDPDLAPGDRGDDWWRPAPR